MVTARDLAGNESREAARRNAAEEARKAQAYLLAQIATQQAALEQTAAHRGEEAKIERMEEAEGAVLAAVRTARSQREQAYQDYRAGERDAEAIAAEYQARKTVQEYRQGERAEYVSPPPACTVENIEQPKPAGSSQSRPWWQRVGDWAQQKIVQPVQQAVPKVMNWVDQHQTEIVIGIGIAAGVAAVILSGGAATPLVAAAWVAGSAAVAGGVAALGTVGLNAYFHRPLGTNVLRNLGYAAGAAAVTATAGFLVSGGVIQQGLYTVGNTASRLCITYPAGCARVGTVMTLWDKVEDLGLQAKLAIQTAQGNPRAAETALELQLERLDNAPGNTTFREIYENVVTLFARHSDEAAQIAGVATRHGDDVLDVFENGILRVQPEAAGEIAAELEAATGRKVWFSPSSGTIYVSRSTRTGLEAVAHLQMAVQSGADEATINQLVEEVAMASTRGSGNRVVLGVWKAGEGYIGDAVESGGVFFDTGDEVWEMLQESGVDPWLVNEAFLRRQLEAGVERVDFISGDIGDTLTTAPKSYRAKEIKWLIDHAGEYGYDLVGNSWIRRIP